jgi:hypothetical protein
MAIRPGSRRLLAALLGATWLLGLFASPLHQILVKHVLCAEHGQLVHASAHAQLDHSGAEQALWVSSEPHGDHDHCTHCSVAPQVTQAATPTVASPSDSGDGDQSDPTVIAEVRTSAARYRLAPKQSPPV